VWVRTGKIEYLHLTRFFGKIFLINFAMGVVTGIVQEFQFGMNWSDYSRFVGDVFGAPLAFEGLFAFFFEATFIGLWIFGWDKLPQKLHLATIWCTAIGSILSAYFIIAANAFMQNPVGYVFNPETNRAELTDFWALLTNPVALAAFPHTIFGAFMFAAGVVISVSAWHLARKQHEDTMRKSLKFGLWGMLVSTAGVVLSGDQLGLAMYAAQPMKMAAAEATFNTVCGADASFSLFTLGTPDGTSELFSIRVPYLLSLLSTHSLDECVHGINDLNAEYAQTFADMGITNFAPVLWVTYWAFRWMIGLGMLAALVAVIGLGLSRKSAKKEPAPWMWKLAIWSFPLALAANIMGWVFTEMGRQPWIVFGLMTTQDGVSPGVSGLEVLISLISFTAIYAALAVVEIRLIIRAAQKGPDTDEQPHEETAQLPSVVY
jgi:cytochrome d ubiquinol oxidase subunit I